MVPSVDDIPVAVWHRTLEKPAIRALRPRTIACEAFSGTEHTTGIRFRLQDTLKAVTGHEASP